MKRFALAIIAAGLLGSSAMAVPVAGEHKLGVTIAEMTVTAAIVGTGGFVGLAKHDVAIPLDQLKMGDDRKLTLPGATRDALKQPPEFQYAER